MKKLLGIGVLGLLLSGCAASWQEANHYTMNRDARINLFNNDIDTLQTIYVGIGSDADDILTIVISLLGFIHIF